MLTYADVCQKLGLSIPKKKNEAGGGASDTPASASDDKQAGGGHTKIYVGNLASQVHS